MPWRPLILAQDKRAWIYFSLKGMAGIVSVNSTFRLEWVNLVVGEFLSESPLGLCRFRTSISSVRREDAVERSRLGASHSRVMGYLNSSWIHISGG